MPSRAGIFNFQFVVRVVNRSKNHLIRFPRPLELSHRLALKSFPKQSRERHFSSLNQAFVGVGRKYQEHQAWKAGRMYSASENHPAINCVEKRPRLDSLPLSHEPRVWPYSSRPEMYPYQIDANEHNKSNSRLDPTLAYPVPLRPSVFQHARFIDKMQPGVARVKQEKYEVYQDEPLSDADPRRWSREDVSRWLQWMSEAFNLSTVRPDRFQMNGKALCLMTMDMFLYRVPEGGNILYQDFQRRLRNAVALQN